MYKQSIKTPEIWYCKLFHHAIHRGYVSFDKKTLLKWWAPKLREGGFGVEKKTPWSSHFCTRVNISYQRSETLSSSDRRRLIANRFSTAKGFRTENCRWHAPEKNVALHCVARISLLPICTANMLNWHKYLRHHIIRRNRNKGGVVRLDSLVWEQFVWEARYHAVYKVWCEKENQSASPTVPRGLVASFSLNV